MQGNERGFTLIEMLLSVALITLLAGLSLPIYFNAQGRNDTATMTETLADALRRAETYARAVNGDAPWGVNFQAGSATLFQGSSYVSRSTGSDETLTVPSDITLGYTGDVVFSKFTGVPASTASISVTSKNGDIQTITVNAKGMVNY